jgi:1,4-dihydroxy-2-naphthoate polyprenyltransferase
MATQGFVKGVAQAGRLKTLPLSLGSVIFFGAFVTATDASLDLMRWLGCLAVAALMHTTGILVSDLFDHRSGADKLAGFDRTAIPTGSLQIQSGKLSVGQVWQASAVLIVVSALIVAILGEASVWPWYLAGLALLWSYAGPPMRFSYVGAGFGELVIAVAYGPLLMGATAAALRIAIPTGVWLGSIVIGVLVAAALGSHHGLHWRSDGQASKRTPFVVYGEAGGVGFIAILDLIAYGVLIYAIFAKHLPAMASLALLGAPGAAVAVGRARQDAVAQRILGLIGAHLAAYLIAVVGLSVGIVAS